MSYECEPELTCASLLYPCGCNLHPPHIFPAEGKVTQATELQRVWSEDKDNPARH
jgi:hypothetical protein